MRKTIGKEERCAVMNAYREQIEFGSSEDTALNLATIVYQQRHPRLPTNEARALVSKALGISKSPA